MMKGLPRRPRHAVTRNVLDAALALARIGFWTVLTKAALCHGFATPPQMASSRHDGELRTQLSLETAMVRIPGSNITLTTRVFNGQLPGPTLVVRPGDTLVVEFTNRLVDHHVPFRNNRLSAPDETNLHFHGLHASGELPSDDTTLVVKPGETYVYQTKIRSDHLPGTHWIHPHRHGSSALQVGGGAVSALIIEDPPETLPPAVAHARDIVFVVQQYNLKIMAKTARKSEDPVWTAVNAWGNATTDPFLVVNGHVQPVLEVPAGVWIRLRVIFAGWLKGTLDWQLEAPADECQVYLLAKDGIYIRDFPRRRITKKVPLWDGGRADLMIRCVRPDKSYNITGLYGTMATLRTGDRIEGVVNGTTVAAESELEPWNWTYPPYLWDLTTVEATPGCACRTSLMERKNTVNGVPYPSSSFSSSSSHHPMYGHVSVLGSVVERAIVAGPHPYHQHVFPFQLVAGFDDEALGGYYRIGDWHDTVADNGTIRYQPRDFVGKVMVHCHRLTHEDKGMMAVEYVQPSGSCRCQQEAADSSNDEDDSRNENIWKLVCGYVVVILTIVSVVVVAWWRMRRKRAKSTSQVSRPGSYGTLPSIDDRGDP